MKLRWYVKVGDLVKLHDTGWRYGGEVGIIVREFPMLRTVEQQASGAPEPFAFKVLVSQGKIISKLKKQMEVVNEN